MAAPRRKVFDESRYVAVAACVLLVTLRLFIGWQFLYEGLWKYDTLDTAQPWTAAGFLKNAQGPFRAVFREQFAEDPDELLWLDQAWVEARWDDWANRFRSHYELTTDQSAKLDRMLTGPASYAVRLDALPAGVVVLKKLASVVRFDAAKKQLVLLDANNPLLPSETIELLQLAPEPAEVTDANRAEAAQIAGYRKAVDDLSRVGASLSYKRQLRVLLGSNDPNRVRQVFSNFKGTLGDRKAGKVEEYYKELLANYDARLKEARRTGLEFERDHLERQWKEIQTLRSELVNPIKALDAEFKAKATDLLNSEQVARGPLILPRSRQANIDRLTFVALIALGLMLIAGFGTRVAAFLGAGMVLSFYLVWPPWPGVPVDPGPEHAYIVNKNLIEVVALLALAALPSGQWFGIDGLLHWGWRRLGSRPKSAGRTTPPTPASRPVVSQSGV